MRLATVTDTICALAMGERHCVCTVTATEVGVALITVATIGDPEG
jgi:hypothetical protein